MKKKWSFLFFKEHCELVEKHPTNQQNKSILNSEDQALISSIIKGIGRKWNGGGGLRRDDRQLYRRGFPVGRTNGIAKWIASRRHCDVSDDECNWWSPRDHWCKSRWSLGLCCPQRNMGSVVYVQFVTKTDDEDGGGKWSQIRRGTSCWPKKCPFLRLLIFFWARIK